MSAEDGSNQPPAAGSDKAPAPKPAATFSSFINKNTTGKKFAPKAARRRPGAAPAASAPAPTATPSAPETPAPTAEPQTSQAETASSNAPAAEPAAAVQLPTPVATQEPTIASTPRPAPSTSDPSTATARSSAALETLPAPAEPLPTPATTHGENQTQGNGRNRDIAQSSKEVGLTTEYLEDEIEGGRSPKRRRTEPLAPPSVSGSQDDTARPPVQHEASDIPHQQREAHITVGGGALAPTIAKGDQTEDASIIEPDGDIQTLPQPRKRRKLPWVAINHPREGEEETVAAAPTKKVRQPPRPRAKKKATADADTEHVEEEEEEEADQDDPRPTRKRPGAKARGKKKVTEPMTQDGEEALAPPRARRPRKAAANLSHEVVEGEEDGVARIADEIVASAVRRKPKPKRRRKPTPDGDEEPGIDGEEGTRKEKKRKGRPPREATPSDAEDREIDPDVTYMDSLAARNVRFGKLSRREREMRTIDWDAVKQRRREEDTRHIASKAEQERADKALAEAGAVFAAPEGSGPQFQLGSDGTIQYVANTGTIDREGDADREIAEMVTVEDQDITARLTTRSFMKNNKRFPNDFLLPGQGRRWNAELTKRFYEALRAFGTDFQMISNMFPGFTRRSIKTKFTREERDNPEGIKEALRGRCEMNEHWDMFLHHSNQTEESFADADEIKRQMAEKDAEYQGLIAAAKAEAEERKRQRELAGLDDEGNEINGDGTGNKENGKGRKKKGKGKQVAFQEEAGVEILGDIGDDDTWGQE